MFFRLLRLDTPYGRKAYERTAGKATPLIRVKSRDLDAEGVGRVPRTAGVRDGLPLLEDGRTLAVTNVVWSIHALYIDTASLGFLALRQRHA